MLVEQLAPYRQPIALEYPRATPDGEQMDFVEVMEVADGMIRAHRVYWGWFGLRLLERS